VDDRTRLCRLDPALALQTLDEAEAWIRERGVVVVTAGNGSLPSLHAACHEPPYKKGSRGFGTWPRTKWWWSFELSRCPGLVLGKLLRGGRGVFLAGPGLAAADALCRAELARAEAGAYGEAAARALALLAEIGPALPEELELERPERERLERAGVLVGRGGHETPRELYRWDQVAPPQGAGGRCALVVAAVRAAVVAPEREVRRWFPWDTPVDELVAGGVLQRTADGSVSSSQGALT
jgi:hypothetical protein